MKNNENKDNSQKLKVLNSIKDILKISFKTSRDDEKEFNDNTNEADNIKEYKILLLGDHSTGKTSICENFVLGLFNLQIEPSKGPTCYKKIMEFNKDEKIYVYLIDVEEKYYKSLPNKFDLYKDVKGIIILYDITRSKTYENAIKYYMSEVKNYIKGNDPIKLLVGNKNDLENLRNVDYDNSKTKAKAEEYDFLELSCLKEEKEAPTGNINFAIKYLLGKIYYADLSEEEQNKLKDKILEK